MALCDDWSAKLYKVSNLLDEIISHGCARSEISSPSMTTPEHTLREAGISNRRQARYQRRMSSLLAGRE